MIDAVAFVLANQNARRTSISVDDAGQKEALNLSFVNDAWWPLVTGLRARTAVSEIDQEIPDEVLAAVSPYQTSHINRFGQYQLHARRAPNPLPFLRKPPNVEISKVDSPGLAAAG